MVDANITNLVTNNDAYNLEFFGSDVDLGGTTSFINTGYVTLGNAATDDITFAAGAEFTGNATTNPSVVNLFSSNNCYNWYI